MTDKWNLRFLEMAQLTATWSKDPSTKVGCVLVDQDKIILAGGFNGFPRGVDDATTRLQDRANKYRFTCHAEANAVASAARKGHSLEGSVCYTTAFPCASCAVLLAQAGITAVYYQAQTEDFEKRWSDEIRAAAMVFSECGIAVHQVEIPADSLAVDEIELR